MQKIVLLTLLISTLLMTLICPIFGQNVSILDASLKWNIGNHCIRTGPYKPYDYWTTYFLHTEGDTLMNEKHYKRLFICNDSLCNKKSLKSYIREEEGRVFLANKTEELLLFDFNLQQGDTMIMNFFSEKDIQYYIRVDSVKSIALQDQEERIFQYVAVFDYYKGELGGYSENDVFVEGIGSLNYGLEYPCNLFLTGGNGCWPSLLCFYSGEDLIYANPEINNCHLSTGLLQLQQPKLLQVTVKNHGILEIQLTEGSIGKLFVFDITGKLVTGQSINQSVTQFCLPSTGVYLFHFESDKGEIQTGKVVVK